MNINCIFLIDPMSYNNLSLYDKSLLSNIKVEKKFLLGNKIYEYSKTSEFELKLIYQYSNKKAFFKFTSYIYSQIKLLIYILRFKPDILHFQWFKLPAIDIFVLHLIKIFFKNSKIIFTAHNVLPHDTTEKYYKEYKQIYEIVNKIIVHDLTSKNEIATRFKIKPDKIYVIPHGILDFKEVNNTIVKSAEYAITFSFLGHLSYYKGIDILIDAWNQFVELQNNSRIKLIVAGEVKDENIREKLYKLENYKNVKIVQKFLSIEEFIHYLFMSDVVLFPYREISQSGLLLTTLAYRKAVIVSNKGGLTQPFLLGKVGWILSELNAVELKNAIEYVSMNKDELDQIETNENLWKKIQNYYSWENIGNQTTKIYS